MHAPRALRKHRSCFPVRQQHRSNGPVTMQVFVEVEKAMDSLPSQRSKASARNDDYEATDAHGAGQLAAA